MTVTWLGVLLRFLLFSFYPFEVLLPVVNNVLSLLLAKQPKRPVTSSYELGHLCINLKDVIFIGFEKIASACGSGL